ALLGRRRWRVRVELFLSARFARTKNGRGDGREPGNSRRSFRLGHGRGEETGLGEDDAECDAYRRSESFRVARGMSGGERDQNDSQRDERESRNVAAGTER